MGNEKPLFVLILVNIGVLGHFLFGSLAWWPFPPWWFLVLTCAGGCIGFVVGLPFYFLALGLIRLGLVDPDTSK